MILDPGAETLAAGRPPVASNPSIVHRVTLFDVIQEDSGGDLQSTEGLRRLMTVAGIGPKGALRLAHAVGSADALADLSHEEIVRLVPRLSHDAIQELRELPTLSALPDGVRAVSSFDTEWPEWAEGVPSPPAVLYVAGSMPFRPAIAVVGTRSPTEFGISVVESVVKEAARRSHGVVSGLAIGIDAAAHDAAIEHGTPTWAVLGSGVEEPTPKRNVKLAERIIATGGGLISEHPPGTSANAQRLVARNRLQVAAANIVVAAQCGIPSGTLHTVRFAIQQGRRLVVPRPRGRWLDEPASAGNVALTDPAGCDPTVLSASGSLAERLATRRPIADLALANRDDVAMIWDADVDD